MRYLPRSLSSPSAVASGVRCALARRVWLVWAVVVWAMGAAGGVPPTRARVSVSPFPYDLTADAVRRVSSLIHSNADVYTVQLDNGVPWAEALSGKPFPESLQDQWRRHKESIAPHHKVYVAIAPLAEDRTSWAGAPKGSSAPAWARDETRLTEELRTAYGKYVLRVVEYFGPDYLNIGVEAGDMAAKLPRKWPQFEALFAATATAVKASHPKIAVGISTGLPFLQMDSVLKRASRVFEQSDYVGISFYPYMSEFYEKFGAARLPAPPAQWREPLEWLHRNTQKPIAICETGYSSEAVRLPKYGLALQGDPATQAQYIEDLADIALRDHYLFTVFFLAADYDALMRKASPGDDRHRMWGRTGFYGTNGVAKPAWGSFQKAWFNGRKAAALKSGSPAPVERLFGGGAEEAPGHVSGPGGELAFRSDKDLFVTPPPGLITLEKDPGAAPYMRWSYTYHPGQFCWAVRELTPGSSRGARGLSFSMRSGRSDPILLQVEESDGEAFYAVVTPSADWAATKLRWADFKVAAGKKRDGVLDPAQLVRITIADAAASDKKATGSRTIDLSGLAFERDSP